MESQIKPSDAHSAGFSTEKKPPGNDRNWTNNGASASPRRSSLFVVDLILRLLAIGATLSAAIVMGTNKQTVIGPIGLRPDGVPILGHLSAKYHYSPAFTFFVVANAVACVYTLISLILSVTGKRAALAVSDMVAVAVVMAGASAAAAIAYVGYKGNSHTGWLKICGAFDRFCHHTAGAIVISFVGVIFFMILTVMSIYSISKRTSSVR